MDVRTQERYDEAHIEGATLIPLDVLEKESKKYLNIKIPPFWYIADLVTEVLLLPIYYSKSGFTKVYNLDEGINSWNY